MARSVTNAELLQALKALTAKVEALAEQGAMRDRIAALEAQVADLARPAGRRHGAADGRKSLLSRRGA